MKAVLSDPPKFEYPLLAQTKSGEVTVLFIANRKGTIVARKDNPTTIGHYSEEWLNITNWNILPVGQTVTLSN